MSDDPPYPKSPGDKYTTVDDMSTRTLQKSNLVDTVKMIKTTLLDIPSFPAGLQTKLVSTVQKYLTNMLPNKWRVRRSLIVLIAESLQVAASYIREDPKGKEVRSVDEYSIISDTTCFFETENDMYHTPPLHSPKIT